MKAQFFSKQFVGQNRPFSHKPETTFSKQFFLSYFLCFLFRAQNCLETCVNCLWNCVTPLFTPLEVKLSKYFFSQKRTPPSSEMLQSLQRWHLKDIDEKNHWLFNQRPNNSQFCVKSVGVLLFQENWLALTFTWQNEP